MPGMPPEHDDTLGNIGPAASGLNLANHFLIAMPSIQDPIFGGTVGAAKACAYGSIG